MYAFGLSSALLTAALASTPTATVTTTHGVSSHRVELEVVEHSTKARSSFGFVVPTDGKVQAFIDRDGDPQRCELEVHPTRTALRLRLDCNGKPAHALEVEATRALSAGKRTLLAEVIRPGGKKSQVFATLR